jgi:hypothetical protein
VRVKRERAEAAIVNYVSTELLSPEAISVAKHAYQQLLREQLESSAETAKEPEKLRAEEAKIRVLLRAGALSSDVAQAALDALGAKRRRIAATCMAPATSIEKFTLGVERYSAAIRNLGEHVSNSSEAAEERSLVHELLGGRGTVFTREGRIGARFQSAGLLDMAELPYKSMTYNFGSGGRI